MDYVDRWYVKTYSLALDSILSYDPREHFDNGYIDEGWALVNERLKKSDLNSFTCAVHAVADFYAHTSYAHFAPKEKGRNRLVLYKDSVVNKLAVDYRDEPFNLADESRFTVNPYYYKSGDREKAIAYCEEKKIISGRFAQKGDPSQGFLEKTFVYIPYQLRKAPGFKDRAALPHHNEIAVDKPLENGAVPADHKLYRSPAEYKYQFNLRFEAAKRHIQQVYEDWRKT